MVKRCRFPCRSVGACARLAATSSYALLLFSESTHVTTQAQAFVQDQGTTGVPDVSTRTNALCIVVRKKRTESFADAYISLLISKLENTSNALPALTDNFMAVIARRFYPSTTSSWNCTLCILLCGGMLALGTKVKEMWEAPQLQQQNLNTSIYIHSVQ